MAQLLGSQTIVVVELRDGLNLTTCDDRLGLAKCGINLATCDPSLTREQTAVIFERIYRHLDALLELFNNEPSDEEPS